MNRDTRFRKNPDIVARGLADSEGGVLLSLETGAYFGINQVGLVIWEYLDGERDVGDLIELLRERVSGGPPDLESDVVAFLNNALQRELILPVD